MGRRGKIVGAASLHDFIWEHPRLGSLPPLQICNEIYRHLFIACDSDGRIDSSKIHDKKIKMSFDYSTITNLSSFDSRDVNDMEIGTSSIVFCISELRIRG